MVWVVRGKVTPLFHTLCRNAVPQCCAAMAVVHTHSFGEQGLLEMLENAENHAGEQGGVLPPVASERIGHCDIPVHSSSGEGSDQHQCFLR
jgi:hypothetical protein